MIKVAKHGPNAGWLRVAQALDGLHEFKNSSGTWRGERHQGDPVFIDTGRLPQSYRNQLVAEKPDYVIYSYGTPIAWHGSNGWTAPDARYSVTTSNHQGTVNTAIAQVSK